jgi:hypothetical protein
MRKQISCAEMFSTCIHKKVPGQPGLITGIRFPRKQVRAPSRNSQSCSLTYLVASALRKNIGAWVQVPRADGHWPFAACRRTKPDGQFVQLPALALEILPLSGLACMFYFFETHQRPCHLTFVVPLFLFRLAESVCLRERVPQESLSFLWERARFGSRETSVPTRASLPGPHIS